MDNILYEVVKEYFFHVERENLRLKVKEKIYKSTNHDDRFPFKYWLSHTTTVGHDNIPYHMVESKQTFEEIYVALKKHISLFYVEGAKIVSTAY